MDIKSYTNISIGNLHEKKWRDGLVWHLISNGTVLFKPRNELIVINKHSLSRKIRTSDVEFVKKFPFLFNRIEHKSPGEQFRLLMCENDFITFTEDGSYDVITDDVLHSLWFDNIMRFLCNTKKDIILCHIVKNSIYLEHKELNGNRYSIIVISAANIEDKYLCCTNVDKYGFLPVTEFGLFRESDFEAVLQYRMASSSDLIIKPIDNDQDQGIGLIY